MPSPNVQPYPLRFRPVLKQTIWGGRRLGTQLNKPIGKESDYAESWEVVDHGVDQSVVENGELAGQTLADLLRDRRPWLMGSESTQRRFPLLLKYLDCNRVLSVQVHPDDQYASQMTPPDLGKTEAWFVVESQPDSLIYAGLREGVDRTMLAAAIEAGQTEQVLHSFHPSPGDCVFIPAGTVHALGGGLVIAEIQQSSDTTFRLFDWNRLGSDGNARPLHIDASLAVTDYTRGPIRASTTNRSAEGWQTLVRCDKFELRSLCCGGAERGHQAADLGGDDRFHIITVPQGTATLSDAESSTDDLILRTGETVLIPAAMNSVQIAASENSLVLAMELPE